MVPGLEYDVNRDGAKMLEKSLVPYNPTLVTSCIKKSYQIICGTIMVSVILNAAAAAARPAFVR